MGDPADSPDDLARLRSLGEELRKLRVGDSRDEVLEQTRLDAWDPPTAVPSTTEVEELLDPATGGRVRATLFQAAAVAPEDYPPDWPFVAEEDVQFVRAATGTESITSMLWPDPGDIEAVLQQVVTAMQSLGWHVHAVEHPSADPRYEYRRWFHCTDRPAGHQWRMLAIGEEAGMRAVVLSEIRSDLWPAPPKDEGGGRKS